MGRVLLVDDEPAVLFTVREVLEERGHEVVAARSGAEALEKWEGCETVLTDLAMPGMDGLALLEALRKLDPSLPVLLLTAHGSEKVAVQAMKAGAWDYLTKPFDIDEVAMTVERALETARLRQHNRWLRAERAIGRGVVAESPAMRRLYQAVERVAKKDVTVLVRGETGTGKELVAGLLHAHSGRADKPLVRFNCAAIPGDLAEAELFGHARGAFTGANTARRGFFAEANGGTLVLDEIGELPLAIQAKLLRALQEGEIQPVGSGRVEKVDVRVVASTNRDLAAEAAAGRFREDLYFRIAVVELVVPPLRDRRDDIPALAAELTRRTAEKFGLPSLRLTDALIARFRAADWPGNVRQLENAIARLAALSDGGELGVGDLDASSSLGTSEPAASGNSLKEQVDAFEKGVIVRALDAAGGNQSEAARRLGTSRVTLLDKIKKYSIAR
jgi:DNA-binding NtrC family response regulator